MGQLTSHRHNRVGKNRQHLCMASGWAGGGFGLGPACCLQLTKGLPSQEADQRRPEGQKAKLGPPGRPGVHGSPGGQFGPSGRYSVQKGPVSWRLGLLTPWMTTPGAEGKREL